MAGVKSEHAADDDAARQAAEVAVELSETDGPQDKGRIAKALRSLGGAASSHGGQISRMGGRFPAWGAPAPHPPWRPPSPPAIPPGPGTLRGRPDGKARISGLRGVAGRGAEAMRRGGDAARHGADAATGTVVRRAGSARRGARRGASSAGRGVTSGMSWLTGQVVAMGPRLRIRDQATLRAQFPGRSDDDIAELLVDRAARATAAVGGATGAWAALPVLPAFPAEVAAETLAVVGIEVKLVAELHEIYGMPAVGSAADRARAYIGSWATRRGVYRVDGGLLLVAGSPLARQLTRRLAARVRRSAFSLSPLLTGAVAGALLNRRETRRFGRQIREELSGTRPAVTGSMVDGRPTADPGA
jgi:hypothetical protein